jgi:hypothetical protein
MASFDEASAETTSPENASVLAAALLSPMESLAFSLPCPLPLARLVLAAAARKGGAGRKARSKIAVTLQKENKTRAQRAVRRTKSIYVANE